jgi:HemY protein
LNLAPTLIPAAAHAGRLVGASGDLRRAARIVETAWKENPHPDLADTYAHLRPGDSARDRLARVEALVEKTPGNVEGALAVARAALDAQEFAIARKALAPLLIVPTQRVAMLMAELEETQHGDEGRAREWMTRAIHARRDPAWTADGHVSDRWMPVSPVTGRLDAFQWKVPVAEMESEGALIESDDKAHVMLDAPPPARAPEVSAPEPRPSDVAEEAAVAEPASARRSRRPASPAPAVEKVIPLLHVPDDPGPHAEPHADPEAEPPPDATSEAWNKLRGLFK